MTTKETAGPGADIVTALQNRINDLEIKLSDAEKDRKGKSFVETGALDELIAQLRGEINVLRSGVAAATKEKKTKEKPDGDNGQANSAGQAGDEFGLGALNILE